MRVFLSYAEEDREIARIITDRFNNSGIDVYNWLSPQERGLLFINRIEEEIPRVNFFLALLSPSFRESFWCRREVGLALQREAQMQSDNPSASFIRVLEVRSTVKADAGLLGGYDWLGFTRPEDLERGIRELAERLKEDARQSAAGAGTTTVGHSPASPPGPAGDSTGPQGSSLFRNREDELEKVLRGLTTGGGSHFWLVVAPPQLGKTWFLNRVTKGGALSGPKPWITSLLDLDSLSPEERRDAGGLLARMLPTTPNTAEQDAARSIAREILRAGCPHLCLLDSAELLDEETAGSLRTSLTEVYHLVQEAGVADVRLGVIVASRRDDYWKGVMPYPRLAPVPLTEFKVEVVQQALHDLARDMNRTLPAADIRRNSVLAHRLTEGLPALLVRCLDWIQAEQWLGMDRLESQELFQKLADPYIQTELLARASLFPGGRRTGGDEPLHVLGHAYRVLAPYRLFTQSHLRHHLGRDADFRAALAALNWSMTDLWRAISGTALLSRPLNEPWQEIHAAIRRLLYRYHCRTDEQRAGAHDEARRFVRIWAQKQVGTEQVVGLVECLWHEANVLRLRRPVGMEQRLAESARSRCKALRPSPAYTLEELQSYAMQRMRNDEEFQETVGSAVFNRLIDIVVEPQEP